MSENSKIQWTHHTFNPWRGCARVSPGCEHCYAESWAKRNPAQFGIWGVNGTRVVASNEMWSQPLKWNQKAAKAGVRHRVFCASLADVAEDLPNLIAPRLRLCELILDTPHLDWLLLTKRPENLMRLFPHQILERCWIGVSAEEQQRADDRIPFLLETPAKVRFVSYEPALHEIAWKFGWLRHGSIDAMYPRVDWIIVGGESGFGARPFAMEWARRLIGLRTNSGVTTAIFVKQLGRHTTFAGKSTGYFDGSGWEDAKGGNMLEWPPDLRVREFPR